MKKEFKLSNYMNPFIKAHNDASEHNWFINHGREKLKKHHDYWDDKRVEREYQYRMENPPYNKGIIPVPPIPTKEELENKFGGKFQDYEILAKIGTSGKEIHKVKAYALPTKDGYILWNASSDCGSQKWNIENPSPIFPIESVDLDKVTCDKCRGIRVKGGKEENKPSQYKCLKCGYTSRRLAFEYGNYVVKRYKCPQCQAYVNSISELRVTNEAHPDKKPKIDILERPLEFSYNFKTKYKNNDNIFNDHETVKASNKEEAIAKITKNHTNYDKDTKVYDFELQRVYSFNGHRIWDKNTNTESEIPVSSFKSKSELKKEAKFKEAEFKTVKSTVKHEHKNTQEEYKSNTSIRSIR
jgi:hypothetical protein